MSAPFPGFPGFKGDTKPQPWSNPQVVPSYDPKTFPQINPRPSSPAGAPPAGQPGRADPMPKGTP